MNKLNIMYAHRLKAMVEAWQDRHDLDLSPLDTVSEMSQIVGSHDRNIMNQYGNGPCVGVPTFIKIRYVKRVYVGDVTRWDMVIRIGVLRFICNYRMDNYAYREYDIIMGMDELITGNYRAYHIMDSNTRPFSLESRNLKGMMHAVSNLSRSVATLFNTMLNHISIRNRQVDTIRNRQVDTNTSPSDDDTFHVSAGTGSSDETGFYTYPAGTIRENYTYTIRESAGRDDVWEISHEGDWGADTELD